MKLFLRLLVAVGGCFVAVLAAAAPSATVLIPEGDYLPLFSAVGTAKTIRLPAYYLDVRPVSNGDFLAFVRANSRWRRSQVAAILADSNYLAAWEGDLALGPKAPVDSPVVNISWFAAQAYARWLGKRLSSTAEWERAAQAGFEVENGSADRSYQRAVEAWLSHPSIEPLPPAGTGVANYYGVKDLIGLVWEWTDDFNVGPGIETSAGGSANPNESFCGGAAVSAGRFTDYPAFLRAEFRSSLRPNYTMGNLGFRCALSQ